MPYQFEKNAFDPSSLGIYIHIPFCVRKCAYCDFYSLAAGRESMEQYHRALMKMIGQMGKKYHDRRVDTVYFGGGTPSCYPIEYLAEELDAIRTRFSLTEDCEITAECNPDSTLRPWLQGAKKAGINRLSMGVQSANDEELKNVGRLHDFKTAQTAFWRAREEGFENISLDLIYGLPDQTMESWQQSVEALLALQPDHLSCYGLKLEEGTPLFLHRRELTLADDDGQADMYLWMVERLEQAGLHQYEISNFARQGKHSQHNLRYWLGQDYLGLGPAAHSYVDGVRGAIPRSLAEFCHGVEEGKTSWELEGRIDEAERAREYVLLGLRTSWGISTEEAQQRFGIDCTSIEKELRFFASYGWAEQTDHRWHFTPEGYLRSNALIGLLEEQLEEQLTK